MLDTLKNIYQSPLGKTVLHAARGYSVGWSCFQGLTQPIDIAFGQAMERSLGLYEVFEISKRYLLQNRVEWISPLKYTLLSIAALDFAVAMLSSSEEPKKGSWKFTIWHYTPKVVTIVMIFGNFKCLLKNRIRGASAVLSFGFTYYLKTSGFSEMPGFFFSRPYTGVCYAEIHPQAATLIVLRLMNSPDLASLRNLREPLLGIDMVQKLFQ